MVTFGLFGQTFSHFGYSFSLFGYSVSHFGEFMVFSDSRRIYGLFRIFFGLFRIFLLLTSIFLRILWNLLLRIFVYESFFTMLLFLCCRCFLYILTLFSLFSFSLYLRFTILTLSICCFVTYFNCCSWFATFFVVVESFVRFRFQAVFLCRFRWQQLSFTSSIVLDRNTPFLCSCWYKVVLTNDFN